MPKINKMPPVANAGASMPAAAESDYSHIDEFLASLSEEERMYAKSALEDQTPDDKEYDKAVGMGMSASSVNEEGEMD